MRCRMRCPSFQFPIKTALPVRSFSSKEYAVHPIIFLELVRCPSEYFLLYNVLLVIFLASMRCPWDDFLRKYRCSSVHFPKNDMLSAGISPPQMYALPVRAVSSKKCAPGRIVFLKRMRHQSDHVIQKNALPIGSVSCKEFAARRIIFLKRIRCPSD